MDGGVLAGVIIALGFVGWLWWDRRRASDDAEARLRRICFGDARQMERLIQFEADRAGGRISRAEAARRAVERHRRDNR